MKIKILALLLAVGLLGQSLVAQSVILFNTTLNGAVTATAQTLVLTSATSASQGPTTASPFLPMAVGWELFVDRELMLVRAISGTTITVTRGVGGTLSQVHPTLGVVIAGPSQYFYQGAPPDKTCTVAGSPLPWVDLISGDIWVCRTGSLVWNAINTKIITYNTTTLTP